LFLKRRTATIYVAFVFGHLIATWICFTKSELIRPTATTFLWREAAEILAFPMIYLQPKSDLDWLLALMLCNSVIWSALLTVVVLLVSGQMRKRGEAGGLH
jgi:hypothetical protein